MINLDANRGTGRTTRMLFDAIQTAYSLDIPVAVVAHDYNATKELRKLAEHILGDDNLLLDKLRFKSLQGSDILQDFKGVVALGYTHTFVDHHVYATLLRDVEPLIKGFHAYDERT